MLRRRKAEHLSLPPKVERSVRVPLRPLQRRWYRALLEKNVSALGPASRPWRRWTCCRLSSRLWL